MEGEGSILEVTGLEKSYGRNKVLKGVDLTVRKGEVIAIIGPSGCGKSTFIRCLNLLEEPDCGKIVYKGTDLVSADKKTRSETLKDIGMVFQQFNLFPTQDGNGQCYNGSAVSQQNVKGRCGSEGRKVSETGWNGS